MKKNNILLMLLLSLMLNGISYGQTVKTVYTIGSTYSLGTSPNFCYPATPSLVLPPQDLTSNTISTNTNTTNSFVFTGLSGHKINDVIKNAYGKGFRHFYFQEGLYIIDTPIDLSNLYGITIEGSGSGTTFKAGSTTLEAIFKISNNYNSKIMNLNMDLKTTLNCGAPTDTADANTGIKIGTQVGRCLFEDIYS